jgi:hypothetical protein
MGKGYNRQTASNKDMTMTLNIHLFSDTPITLW